ncbi:hypothetical protein MPSEU_000195900 [Mayamaea pseudoterrestris]|nr:hypothetical protein MPSEU_000195900 [Mayamaea pseudoterrestris]
MEGNSSIDDNLQPSMHATPSLSLQDTNASIAATLQADSVLESIGGESHLDGFNLLGVIANPRGLSLTSSFHGRYNGTSGTTGSQSQSAAASTTEANGMFSSTYQSIESTISQATEQMEYMNSVLEDWSRQILEESYYNQSDYDYQPESQLEELPRELQNLSLTSVNSYLQSSGDAAESFRNRTMQQQQSMDRSIRTMSSSSEHSNVSLPQTDDIPSVFFQMDFDLTEPDTFRELLLIDDDNDDQQQHNASMPTISSSDLSEDSGTFDVQGSSIHDWFLLQPPEAFTSFLDKVELSLLHQVRAKSGAFFEESLRFAQLQEGIQVLMKQVDDLKHTTLHLQQDLLEPMEIVPVADTQRTDLQRLLLILDRANELLRCKSSIGGFLSAQDDSTAIEQIQYARRLLAGQGGDDGDEVIELHRLQALKSVESQLDQFEQLVTTNLRDELVEIFLDWNTNSSSVPSMYNLHNGGSPSKSSQQQVQQRVREIVTSLEKCNGLPQLRASYASRLEDIIRMTVRTTVGEFAAESDGSSSVGATGMSLERFLDCLDMLFESILTLLNAASGVNDFCMTEGYIFAESENKSNDNGKTIDTSAVPSGPMVPVLASAAELASKSISELVRMRKEAHSLVSLDEMKKIWDKCMSFAAQTEAIGGHSASNLRSTLLAQAKAFVERKHESNMSALVAALDSERWTQWEVKHERQIAINRLCQGRSVIMSTADEEAARENTSKSPLVEVEGRSYKVVWSCLLLVEMTINNIAAATYFPSLSSNIVAKVSELLRLFNSRSTQLVLGAGAIHSAARLKSINAKHLSMVTQCLGMTIALIPRIRSALMTHLPTKQHMLLTSFDQIRKEYADHNEKVLNKFVTIIGGIVEHGLAPKIPGTDFDAKSQLSSVNADGSILCCVFFEGVSTNARKMHQVLASLLPHDHLQDVFSRIFSFLDQKIPSLFISMSEALTSDKNGSTQRSAPAFRFPNTDGGKKQMLLEAEVMTKNLNALPGVFPWDFTIVSVLGKHMMYELYLNTSLPPLHNKGEEQNDVTGVEVNGPTPASAEAEPLLTAGFSRDQIDIKGNGLVIAEDVQVSEALLATGDISHDELVAKDEELARPEAAVDDGEPPVMEASLSPQVGLVIAEAAQVGEASPANGDISHDEVVTKDEELVRPEAAVVDDKPLVMEVGLSPQVGQAMTNNDDGDTEYTVAAVNKEEHANGEELLVGHENGAPILHALPDVAESSPE